MAMARGTGTQAIERATLVLRVLAERGRSGWRISDLASRTRLPLSTCHRILDGLVRQRLATRLPDRTRYVVGPLIGELAAARPDWLDLPAQAAPRLRQLARRHRAVSFLHARSDGDFVCLVRENGVEMRALTIERGSRRPLLTSAGGVAILLGLAPAERRAVVNANLAELAAAGEERICGIETMLRESEACGYGLNLAWFVAGVHAFAVAVLDPGSGEPVGSIGMSGLPERLPLSRIEAVVPDLRMAAEEVARHWVRNRPG